MSQRLFDVMFQLALVVGRAALKEGVDRTQSMEGGPGGSQKDRGGEGEDGLTQAMETDPGQRPDECPEGTETGNTDDPGQGTSQSTSQNLTQEPEAEEKKQEREGRH